MCTETFLRLPEEKRSRFLDAAWEEFTTTSLQDASINQIVQRARIPRGSFYQYFADKEDLFGYLQDMIMRHLVREYCGVMQQADGDIFRAQMLCFDRVASRGRTSDILFERCIRILRHNPGLLPRVAMEGKLMKTLLENVWGLIDRSMLRSQEDAFVCHTFGLTLVALAVAAAACLEAPEDITNHRQALEIQLNIIKQGSLADACRTER